MQAALGYGPVRRTRRYSWMFSGWHHLAELPSARAGTEFVTIGVPDDFHAVRIGLANLGAAPWTVARMIACASACWNDYFNPLDAAGALRPATAWSPVTFAQAGMDRDVVAAGPDAPASIVVAGNPRALRMGDDPPNPVWSFTDWVPCESAGADPATGMRVLMLRALVPGGQTLTHTNGAMDQFDHRPERHAGYDYFVGGMCHGHDRVTNPEWTAGENLTPEILVMNRIANGPIMALVQVLTRRPGIIGMVTGDSHQAGTATNSQINNFLLQCLLPLGRETRGVLPIGLVNTAAGGLTSGQFFPRMSALLDAVRPGLVVMPGWSFNDTTQGVHADKTAERVVFARMLLAAEEARRAGAVPVFLTPFPRDRTSMTPAVTAVWRAQRHALLTLRESGEIVLDATPLLGATSHGEFDGTYRNGLSIDQMHPNDVGHAAVARALAPIVRDLVGFPKAAAPDVDTEPGQS